MHATIRSVCECQAVLSADLDPHLCAASGRAIEYGSRVASNAPVQTFVGANPRFQAAWLCPFCMRHVLRSFDASILAWRATAPAS